MGSGPGLWTISNKEGRIKKSRAGRRLEKKHQPGNP
jgi:hypothetical protein